MVNANDVKRIEDELAVRPEGKRVHACRLLFSCYNPADEFGFHSCCLHSKQTQEHITAEVKALDIGFRQINRV